MSDTLSSRGGLNDFRIAGSYRLGDHWAVGAGFHIITGSNRLTSTRVFDDPGYLSSRQEAELSFAGIGVSVGVMRQFGPNFAVSAMARIDGHLNVDRRFHPGGYQSTCRTALGLGMTWHPAPTLDVAGQALFRTWSAPTVICSPWAGPARRTRSRPSAGAEYTSDPRRPYQRPIRFGARYATLPVSLGPGQEQGHEFGVSAGSGLRFAQQRAGLDLASNTSGARKACTPKTASSVAGDSGEAVIVEKP